MGRSQAQLVLEGRPSNIGRPFPFLPLSKLPSRQTQEVRPFYLLTFLTMIDALCIFGSNGHRRRDECSGKRRFDISFSSLPLLPRGVGLIKSRGNWNYIVAVFLIWLEHGQIARLCCANARMQRWRLLSKCFATLKTTDIRHSAGHCASRIPAIHSGL